MWLTRDKHTEGKVSTFVDRVINNVWMVTGLTAWFVSMLTLFSQIRLPILFIILLTMGMGTTITGLIIRFRPATAGGAAAIVLAPVSLIVSGYWMPTLFAVGFVVMMIIPGISSTTSRTIRTDNAMDGQKISETEALDIIARVFDRNMRRMNYVRGELFIFWGALLSLTALAEYGLYHWTGDVRVLWSWLAPLVCGYIWTVRNSRREGPRPHGVRRPADPDMGHAGDDLGRRDRLCRNHPREYDKPRRRHAAAARHGTGYHRRILPGERLPAIGVVPQRC